MFNFFKKKNISNKQDNNKNWFNFFFKLNVILKQKKEKENRENISYEPLTNAKIRLIEQQKKDYGHEQGLKIYNEHKTQINNQWINPYTSLNTGWASNPKGVYIYQPINYYECAKLSQDPLLNKILSCYSFDTLSKGWKNEKIDNINILSQEQNILKKILFKTFEMGGCLVYLDFGLQNLEQPIKLQNMNMKNFKDFKIIEPLDCVALDVNCNNPSADDYMKPKKWYITGLGVCDSSNFIHFSYNEPANILKPLTMYFGTPLSSFIKQDIYNCNMISQSIAELISRYRYVWLKTDMNKLGTTAANDFLERLDSIASLKDNYQVDLLDLNEEIIQQTTTLSGLFENETFFYQLLASKTDIPYTKLLGKSPEGMNSTGEGDLKNYYDKLSSLQKYFSTQIAIIESILYAKETNQKYKLYNNIIFNPLFQLNDLQKSQCLSSYSSLFMSLSQFFTPESINNFISKNSSFNFNMLELSQTNEMDYEDENQTM